MTNMTVSRSQVGWHGVLSKNVDKITDNLLVISSFLRLFLTKLDHSQNDDWSKNLIERQ